MSLIPTAYAAGEAAAGSHGSPYTTIIMLVVFFAIFYFLLIRPQSKRAKEHRNLLANLGEGDEVVTNGGMMGTIKSIDDTVLSLEIANGIVIKMQKMAISTVLPKGTLSGRVNPTNH